ncbi:ABC transporter permease [Streptosporangium carneum]|uniref:ABC transporter permease n=1 Tax=Streptosporangium carneum TaxID=47481 RepID=A0A9W6MCE5_9ACTN|nr:ABC transporter permease [Streptosporangium carneum]GLK09354.1 ABC transporter permease [Streptosporangium carneum]
MAILTLISRRLAAALVLLGVLSVLTYGLLVASPGGPEQVLLGNRPSTAETRAAIRAEYHLDDPFPLRYARWLGDAVRGDFGISIYSREPVVDVIADRLPVTAGLAGYALLITVAVGVPVGLVAAMGRGGTLDQGITLTSLVLLAVPPFALSILLLYGFAVTLGWFPVFGAGETPMERISHLTLPAIALAAAQAAMVVRQMRAAALDLAGQDFLTFAKARGLPRRRIWIGYALRNAALPVLTVGGLLLAANLTGALFVEQAFGLHGLGALLIGAVGQKDIPVVQALVLFGGAIVVAVNLLIDLAYLVVDPRVRHGAVAS